MHTPCAKLHGGAQTFTTAAYMLGGGKNDMTGVRWLGWSMTCALAVSLLAHRFLGQVLVFCLTQATAELSNRKAASRNAVTLSDLPHKCDSAGG